VEALKDYHIFMCTRDHYNYRQTNWERSYCTTVCNSILIYKRPPLPKAN